MNISASRPNFKFTPQILSPKINLQMRAPARIHPFRFGQSSEISREVFSCKGGGSRGILAIGALLPLEESGKWHPERFDVITGTSIGSLVAAFTANNWKPSEMAQLFQDNDFRKLLSPFWPLGLREKTLMIWPLSLKPLARFIDSLGLNNNDRLYINTYDALTEEQVIYCQSGKKPDWAIEDSEHPTRWETFDSVGGLGNALIRSMAFMGTKADPEGRYLDGGFKEDPLLSFIPPESSNLFYLNLGHPSLVRSKKNPGLPKDIALKILKSIEVVQKRLHDKALSPFKEQGHLFMVEPGLYDDLMTLEFNVKPKKGQELILQAKETSKPQYKDYSPPPEKQQGMNLQA